MIRTVYANGSDIGAIALRGAFEIPTGRNAVSADEHGQPIYKAEAAFPGYVNSRTARDISSGSVTVKMLGDTPDVHPGLVMLEGLVTISQWTNGRGAGLRSEVTVTAEGIRQARDGELPRFDQEIPVSIPERVVDKKLGDVPVGILFLAAVDRQAGALYRWGVDFMIDPVGPWKVDGLGQFDSPARPPLEWVGRKIRPVGLTMRWYVPETPSNYDKASILLAAKEFILDGAATNGHHNGNGGGGRKSREPAPVPATVGASEPSEG
jgi:hypothetical protein